LKIYILSFHYFLINKFVTGGSAVSTIVSLFIFATLLMWQSTKLIGYKIINLIDIKSLFLLLLTIILVILPMYLLKIKFNDFWIIIIAFILYFPIVYFILLKTKLLSVEIVYKLVPDLLLNKIKKIL